MVQVRDQICTSKVNLPNAIDFWANVVQIWSRNARISGPPSASRGRSERAWAQRHRSRALVGKVLVLRGTFDGRRHGRARFLASASYLLKDRTIGEAQGHGGFAREGAVSAQNH